MIALQAGITAVCEYSEVSALNAKSENNKETINDFFTRKTNTKYYIKLEHIPIEYGDLSINNEIIDENTGKILIEGNKENIIDFISTNEKLLITLKLPIKLL